MSVDFNAADPRELQSVTELAERVTADCAENGDDTIVQYQGGYTLLRAYEQYMKLNQRGKLQKLSTELGARLMFYAGVWFDINWAQANARLGDTEEMAKVEHYLNRTAEIVRSVLDNPEAQQTYDNWLAECRNVPEDATPAFLYLVYTSQLMRFAQEMVDLLNGKRTLH